MSAPDTHPSLRVGASAKERFLAAYEEQHVITMRVLRAFPEEALETKPHEKSKSARELAWVFAIERWLGIAVFRGEFEQLASSGGPPPAPASWDELLATVQSTHREFGDLVRATPEPELDDLVRFMVGPKQVGDVRRIDWLWFLVFDEIHHRGQLSVYLRMSGARVPSIFGPSADEPWM